MKQQLRKPENWQDFETLCKKLWGEIWECPEIKKNGRTGQVQHGVDVFGIPKGESSYYGIQCKGKDDYTDAQLSEKEINEELKKAMKFQPKLKKFYIATTANKDSKIEEFVRRKNIEFAEAGFFEVHLFSWEDIVDLIDDNKKSHDWYVKNIDFSTKHQAQLLFSNGNNVLESSPVFRRISVRYFDKSLLNVAVEKMFNSDIFKFGQLDWRLNIDKEDFIKSVTVGIKDQSEEEYNDPQPVHYNTSMMDATNYVKYNRSVCVIQLCLKNVGSEVLEKYRINLRFEGAIIIDSVDKHRHFFDRHPYKYNVRIKPDFQAEIKPFEEHLVQNDTVCFDEICFKPYANESQVKIFWQLFSKDYNEAGELRVNVKPIYELSEEIIFIENPDIQPLVVKIKNKYEYQDTDFNGKVKGEVYR
jgi:hypothetical protein